MLRRDAKQIYTGAIGDCMPAPAVRRCLSGISFSDGKIILVAIGKAAWEMADEALRTLGERISSGVVVTKYGHSRGSLTGLEIVEAGHPVPDENSFRGAQLAIEAVSGLTERDTVLFLVSGGGSALFELSPLPLEELRDINTQLMACGADIHQINTIRKRLSLVKGGRFARCCGPARIVAVMLSDVLGDRMDMIASGPVCPDESTCAQAEEIRQRFGLRLSEKAMECLKRETPKEVRNAEYFLCGSVRQLCRAAGEVCRSLGYETRMLGAGLTCSAREAGELLAAEAKALSGGGRKIALIAGGETVVHVTGQGLGGRNQELALAAADRIGGEEHVMIFAVGSDGTDGPTDAAGGIVDGSTRQHLAQRGISIPRVLEENDSYHALEQCGGLIKTGPTGTNVNDLYVALIDG